MFHGSLYGILCKTQLCMNHIFSYYDVQTLQSLQYREELKHSIEKLHIRKKTLISCLTQTLSFVSKPQVPSLKTLDVHAFVTLQRMKFGLVPLALNISDVSRMSSITHSRVLTVLTSGYQVNWNATVTSGDIYYSVTLSTSSLSHCNTMCLVT